MRSGNDPPRQPAHLRCSMMPSGRVARGLVDQSPIWQQASPQDLGSAIAFMPDVHVPQPRYVAVGYIRSALESLEPLPTHHGLVAFANETTLCQRDDGGCCRIPSSCRRSAAHPLCRVALRPARDTLFAATWFPGAVGTPMLRSTEPLFGSAKALEEAMAALHILARMRCSQEIAEALVFYHPAIRASLPQQATRSTAAWRSSGATRVSPKAEQLGVWS